MNRNPISNEVNGLLKFDDAIPSTERWETAKDCVDYPVFIKELFYKHDGEEKIAEGATNTGRDSQFFGVVVDRDRTGTLSMINAVTGLYGTLATHEAYRDLQEDFVKVGLNAVPHSVYVSGDGGRHLLSVRIEDPALPEWMGMHMNLSTSVDGSKRHALSLVVWDKVKNCELLGVGGQSYRIAARHTTTIGDRHIAFEQTIIKLASEFSKTILPMVELLGQKELTKTSAIEMLTTLMNDAGIPEKHIVNASTTYEKSITDHSVLTVLQGISSYLNDELEDKQERLETFKEKFNKNSKVALKKLLKD